MDLHENGVLINMADEDNETLKNRILTLETENARLKSGKVLANPAMVGLCGFGATTLLLQFHNVGWMGVGPVLAAGLIFGGAAQLFAGFQEFATGNNFGFCAFTAYGSFWISLSVILVCNHHGIYKSSETDIGFFLLTWTFITLILLIASSRHNLALFITFVLLLIGFILLDISHFAHVKWLTVVAGYELMACAFSAWYCMTAALYKSDFKRDILPVGQPLQLMLRRRHKENATV